MTKRMMEGGTRMVCHADVVRVANVVADPCEGHLMMRTRMTERTMEGGMRRMCHADVVRILFP